MMKEGKLLVIKIIEEEIKLKRRTHLLWNKSVSIM